MTTNQIMDALIKIGKIKDGRMSLIGCDIIGQDGLYEIQAQLLNLMDKLDHKRTTKEFPYMYREEK